MKLNTALKSSIFLPSFFVATTLSSFLAEVNGQITLSTGGYFACVLEQTSGQVKCWGHNEFYQLNTGSQTDELLPIDVSLSGASPADSLNLGWSSLCIITPPPDSRVMCIGYNVDGGLGNGSFAASPPNAEQIPTLMSNTGPGGYQIKKLSVGFVHTCAIDDQDRLLCTGNNSNGQLGIGSTSRQSTLQHVSSLKNGVVEVSASSNYVTCAIEKKTQKPFCWGRNDYGQLGLGVGDTTDRNIPTEVYGSLLAKKIATGRNHTCLIDYGQELWCTGRNDDGELGIASNSPTQTPMKVNLTNRGAKEISLGRHHSCFIDVLTKVWCMGKNLNGQLGNDSMTNSNVPVEIAIDLEHPVQISLGMDHSCVSTAYNKIYCWGKGDFGQLGQNNISDLPIPTLVKSLNMKQYCRYDDPNVWTKYEVTS